MNFVDWVQVKPIFFLSCLLGLGLISTPSLTHANDARIVNSQVSPPHSYSTDTIHVTGKISNTLYKDARAKGIPESVIHEFIRIMNGTVDFRKDLHRKDGFEMAYMVKRDLDGKLLQAGPLLYARLDLDARDHSFYRFDRGEDRGKYYSPDGRALHVHLKTSPLPSAIMTSAYGKRRHPISGKWKNHAGIDLSAPAGTPVFATASGKVIVKKYNRSYGNMVEIQHARDYVTTYAHLKGFAPELAVGQSVERGEIIGYVGSTGRSTGSHLHYEVKLGARNIDPVQVQKQSDWNLIGSETTAFAAERNRIDGLRGADESESLQFQRGKTLPATP